MRTYYVLPSDDKGSYGADKCTRKRESIGLARSLFKEFKKDAASNFRVDVFLGDENDYYPQLDPVFSILGD